MTDPASRDDATVARALPVSEVPLVDFAPFLHGDRAARQAVADAIARACETVGFFYLTGHGVPEGLRAAMFDAAASLFHLPPGDKEPLRADATWNRGWIRPAPDAAPGADSRSFEQYRIQREFAPDDPDLRSGSPFCQPNRWPPQLPAFRAAGTAWFDAMSDLSHALLHAFALGLGLPEDRFDRYFAKPIAQLSLMYYPPLPDGAGNEVKNTSAHVDEGPVVILAQDAVAGLEIKTVDGRWLSAPPVPGAFTINIGNMMMWWSNGRYRSTLHRVRNVSRVERFSLPFFANPDEETVVAPLPELVARDGAARYEPVPIRTLLGRFFKSDKFVPFRPEPIAADGR